MNQRKLRPWLLMLAVASIFSKEIKAEPERGTGFLALHEGLGWEFRLSPLNQGDSLRYSIFNRAELSFIGNAAGTKYVDVYSSARLIDFYRIGKKENLLFGILSPIVCGSALTFATMIGFADESGLFKKYGYLFLIPPYLLNPEIRIFPEQKLKIYAGYSYDFVNDGKVRQIFSYRVGGILDVFSPFLRFKFGYERISYRKMEYRSEFLAFGFQIGKANGI